MTTPTLRVEVGKNGGKYCAMPSELTVYVTVRTLLTVFVEIGVKVIPVPACKTVTFVTTRRSAAESEFVLLPVDGPGRGRSCALARNAMS